VCANCAVRRITPLCLVVLNLKHGHESPEEGGGPTPGRTYQLTVVMLLPLVSTGLTAITAPPGDLSSQEHNPHCIHSKLYSVGVCDMAVYHSGFVQNFPTTPRNLAQSTFILQRFGGLTFGERTVLPVRVKRVYRAVQKQPRSSSPSALHGSVWSASRIARLPLGCVSKVPTEIGPEPLWNFGVDKNLCE
jgi:hypothetical protein